MPIGTKLSPTLGTPAIRYISGACIKIKTDTSFGYYKVQIWVSSVAEKAFIAIRDRYPPATIHAGIVSMTALVPEPILHAITPDLVADFDAAHSQIVKKTFSDRTRSAYDPVCFPWYFVASGLILTSSGRSFPLFKSTIPTLVRLITLSLEVLRQKISLT